MKNFYRVIWRDKGEREQTTTVHAKNEMDAMIIVENLESKNYGKVVRVERLD